MASLISRCVPPLKSGIACLAYLNPGIACLASQSSDRLDALWARLSGVQSSVTFVRLNVIGHSWGGMFNCPVSTRWLNNCALAHKKKTFGLHHLPLGEKNVKYKMFPLVSVQVQHGEPGNMHP